MALSEAEPLTERQEKVLSFIRQSVESKGFAPTLEEIADHLGGISKNGVRSFLEALRKKNRIRIEKAVRRGIVLCDRALKPIHPIILQALHLDNAARLQVAGDTVFVLDSEFKKRFHFKAFDEVSPARARLLLSVHVATLADGFPPTIRRIQKLWGAGSTNAVFMHVQRLAALGRLRTEKGVLVLAQPLQITPGPD